MTIFHPAGWELPAPTTGRADWEDVRPKHEQCQFFVYWLNVGKVGSESRDAPVFEGRSRNPFISVHFSSFDVDSRHHTVLTRGSLGKKSILYRQ